MKEHRFETLVCRDLENNDNEVVAAIKIKDRVGWPDRMFLLRNGLVLFLEFKRDKKKYGLSPAQKKVKDLLEGNGHYYMVFEIKDKTIKEGYDEMIEAIRHLIYLKSIEELQ